jgi:hypothetical protein
MMSGLEDSHGVSDVTSMPNLHIKPFWISFLSLLRAFVSSW